MGWFSYQYLNAKREMPLVRESRGDRYGKKISERLVRCIWLDQLFKDDIFTTDGRKIKVLSPGWWNLGEGPDFKKTVISIDGEKVLKGDAEVHVYSSDWKKHGHHRDERYKNVIIHVFMWNDLKPPLLPLLQTSPVSPHSKGGEWGGHKEGKGEVLQLEISQFLKEEIEHIEDTIDIYGYPYKSPKEYGDCSSGDAEKIGSFLDIAGDARVIEKAERFKSSLNGCDWEQLLYEGIMESLGYRRNKLQFMSLAKAIPLQTIKDAIRRHSYKKRIMIIQSLLLGAGGLIPQNPPFPPFAKGGKWEDYSQEVKDYIKTISREWNKYKIPIVKNIMWDFYGTRPANLPFRRIAGISHFLSSNTEKGLIDIFLSEFLKSSLPPFNPPLSPFTKGGVRGIMGVRDFIKKIDTLFTVYDDFWSFRYTFKGRRFANKKRLIGQDRVLTIIVDVLIPIMFLYSKENRDSRLEEIVHNVYTGISRLPSNNIIRFMERRLLRGERHIINSARRGQALIQIFNDYCASNEDGCFGCSLKNESKSLKV
ncbi:MAG: DUF2851 family protein [Nitrospinae bacterium]|nr:DUF2851 family protein [Nitrospinota bacterium]